MIPKIIHYCWFGGNPLPELAQKCLASWEACLPGYEIRRWDESNFDLNVCPYVQEAYEAKKWAFVSDYARFWILYHFGGLYFDTDVELIRNPEDIVARGPFMGSENAHNVSGLHRGVNPGLGLGAEPGMAFYGEMLERYESLHFRMPDGSPNPLTVVNYTTELMVRHGYRGEDRVENVDRILVYPPAYFCPLNYASGKLTVTPETVSIHHYCASWHSGLEKLIIRMEQCDPDRHPGEYRLRRAASFPFRVVNKLRQTGLHATAALIRRKLHPGQK